MKWLFPILPSRATCAGIPVGGHAGAFGTRRSHDRHGGVDLYTKYGAGVWAVEDGKVVAIEPFTGFEAGCPWWLDTRCVKVEGESGVVCYGEIEPSVELRIGNTIKRGDYIGFVIPVLKAGGIKKDVEGHSDCMLHIQLFKAGTYGVDDDWELDGPMPDNIVDPTKMLIDAEGAPKKLLMKEWKPVKKKDVKLRTVTLTTKDFLFGAFIAACTGHVIVAILLMILVYVLSIIDAKRDAQDLKDAV